MSETFPSLSKFLPMGYLACLLAIYTAVSTRADVIENLVFTGTATCINSDCNGFGSGPITGTYSLDVTTQTIVGAWSFSTPSWVLSSSRTGAIATNGVRLGDINPVVADTTPTYEFLQLFFPIADIQEIGALPTNVYAPPYPGAPAGSFSCTPFPGSSCCGIDYAITGATALATTMVCTFGLGVSSTSVSSAGANSSGNVTAS